MHTASQSDRRSDEIPKPQIPYQIRWSCKYYTYLPVQASININIYFFQILTFLDKVVDSASEFDDEQRYSRSMELEPRKPVNGVRKKSITRLLLNGV